MPGSGVDIIGVPNRSNLPSQSITPSFSSFDSIVPLLSGISPGIPCRGEYLFLNSSLDRYRPYRFESRSSNFRNALVSKSSAKFATVFDAKRPLPSCLNCNSLSTSFPFDTANGEVSGAKYFNRGLDFNKSKDFTLRDRILGADRKFVAEVSLGSETVFACLNRGAD